jgi:hypothetical protein
MFVDKAASILTEVGTNVCFTWVGSDLTRKHYTFLTKKIVETNTLAYFAAPSEPNQKNYKFEMTSFVKSGLRFK